jgi:hypothetical protein
VGGSPLCRQPVSSHGSGMPSLRTSQATPGAFHSTWRRSRPWSSLLPLVCHKGHPFTPGATTQRSRCSLPDPRARESLVRAFEGYEYEAKVGFHAATSSRPFAIRATEKSPRLLRVLAPGVIGRPCPARRVVRQESWLDYSHRLLVPPRTSRRRTPMKDEAPDDLESIHGGQTGGTMSDKLNLGPDHT